MVSSALEEVAMLIRVNLLARLLGCGKMGGRLYGYT